MLHGQWIYITLVLLAVVSVIYAVTVKLGHSATIPCKQNCTTVKWQTNNKEILRFSGGKCTVAPEFKGRTECFEEKIRSGDISLIISSAVYNDQGWYYTTCDGKDHCDQKIEVLVPTVVNVSVGAQATLPCFSETGKNSDFSSVYIQWEKDTKLVVKLENGVISYGSGFEQRAMVSIEGYKMGDLSLSINNVRFSDSGLFRCSLKDGAYGYPHAVSLTVEGTTSSMTPVVVVSTLVCVSISVLGFCVCVRKRQKEKREKKKEDLLSVEQSETTNRSSKLCIS